MIMPTPTFYYKHECQDSLIHSFDFKGFCVNSKSLNLLLFVMKIEMVHIHRHSPSALSVL